jgi:hypothetical protein
MQQAGVSHDIIETTLAIGGILIGLIQGLTFYILTDIRNRLVRLEDLALEGKLK